MTVLWLIVWLFNGFPTPDFSGTWNSWAISLVICGAIDLFGGGVKASS